MVTVDWTNISVLGGSFCRETAANVKDSSLPDTLSSWRSNFSFVFLPVSHFGLLVPLTSDLQDEFFWTRNRQSLKTRIEFWFWGCFLFFFFLLFNHVLPGFAAELPDHMFFFHMTCFQLGECWKQMKERQRNRVWKLIDGVQKQTRRGREKKKKKQNVIKNKVVACRRRLCEICRRRPGPNRLKLSKPEKLILIGPKLKIKQTSTLGHRNPH